jgi:HEPN domain-containing protein
MSVLNRTLLQQLAEQHLEDARVLLEHKRWAGAYYLAGYSVECALKACIAKRTREHDFPDRDLGRDVFTHDLSKLLGLAGLSAQLGESRDVKVNWRQVGRWSESFRYEPQGEQEAHDLFEAISDNQGGVLAWIKLHW